MRDIAALYVEENGSYYGLPNVDPWDERRDARKYSGPYPIVGHPPCQRWGKLWAGQPLWIKRTGQRKIKGDDGGCFAHCLAALRQWGGGNRTPLGKPRLGAFWIEQAAANRWLDCRRLRRRMDMLRRAGPIWTLRQKAYPSAGIPYRSAGLARIGLGYWGQPP